MHKRLKDSQSLSNLYSSYHFSVVEKEYAADNSNFTVLYILTTIT